MRTATMVLFAALAAGCASNEPPPAESAPIAKAPLADDANRRLTKSECESLSLRIVDACNSRGNDRSFEADGWCSDMLRRNEGGGSWVGDDCQAHFRYMDAFCFQGAKNAHGMMDCDRTVDRAR